MKITYVIITWNSEKYIRKCLQSIFSIRDYTNDLIVIDNGSTDATVSIIKEFQRCRTDGFCLKPVFLNKNTGTTFSRNIGLRRIESDTDYICVLDSDAYLTEKALTKLIGCLQSDERLGIIGPQMVSPTGDIQLSGRNFPTIPIKLLKAFPIKSLQKIGKALETPKSRKIGDYYSVEYLLSACWLMKAGTLWAVGLLDENIFYAPEDVDYCIRVWKCGYFVGLCAEAQIVHEYQRISKKKIFSQMNLEHIRGLFYLFRKHKYLLSPPSFEALDSISSR